MVYKKIARFVLWLEPVITFLNISAMWYPVPERDRWAWVLLLYIPVFVARYVVHGRVITKTPLDAAFLVFLVLGFINPFVAPYTRGYLILARPIFGVILYYNLIEWTCKKTVMGKVMTFVIGLALLIGILGISATQWNEKVRSQLPDVINIIPVLRGFPGAERGFNANEIAGAISSLVCVAAGASIYTWQKKAWWRWIVTPTFVLLLVSLMLGQSRTAIVGGVLGFAVMIPLLIPRGKWQWAAWVGFGLLVAFQIAIIANLFNPEYRDALRERDENSLETRLNMWQQGINILRDYPFSGVGLSMFRDDRVKNLYPIPRYEDRNPPHIHNEPLQAGMDMGIPGIIVFLSFYAGSAYMLRYAWQHGDGLVRAMAVACGTGLLAHAVYGLADAVTLWDRLAVVFWVMLGLAGSLYVVAQQSTITSSILE